MDWIKSNWVLITALATMSAAWGQQQMKVENLEQAVIQQAANAKKLEDVREQSIRQDEKLKAIEKSQQTQEQLMRDILESNRAISRKIAK